MADVETKALEQSPAVLSGAVFAKACATAFMGSPHTFPTNLVKAVKYSPADQSDTGAAAFRAGHGPDRACCPGPDVSAAFGSEAIPIPYSTEARVDDVVEDRAESVAEPEAETRLVVRLELSPP